MILNVKDLTQLIFFTEEEKNPKGLDNAVKILHLTSMFLLNFKVNPIHRYIFINLIYLSLYQLYIHHFMETLTWPHKSFRLTRNKVFICHLLFMNIVINDPMFLIF